MAARYFLGGVVASALLHKAASLIVKDDCERKRSELREEMKQRGKFDDYGYWHEYRFPFRDDAREYRLAFARLDYGEQHPLSYLWNKAIGRPKLEFYDHDYQRHKKVIKVEKKP